MAKNKITWTEIAVQLAGEVPSSCRIDQHGQMWIKTSAGDRIIFQKKDVDRTMKEIEGFAAAEAKAKQPAKPGPKPKAAPK